MGRPGARLPVPWPGASANAPVLSPCLTPCACLCLPSFFPSFFLPSPGMEDKAEIAQHSTTEQAGAFGAAVAARNLVLTHFSAR